MNCLTEWWSNIDWAATGSMISGLGACGAIVFAIFIAHKQNELTRQIAEKQLKQADFELKMALYDKRYICYQLITKYLYIGGLYKHQLKEFSQEIQRQLIESVYYNNEVDREVLVKKLQSTTVNFFKLTINDQCEKDKEKNAEVARKLLNIDYEYSEKQKSIIRTAKFCFPIEIADPINEYISLIFSWDAYEQKCLNQDKILKLYEYICTNKIVPQMEALLKISYEEMSKGDM